MAEPLSVTVVGGSTVLAALSAAANASDLVQGMDSYVSLVDPAAGCSLDLEPFVLRKSPKRKEQTSPASSKKLRPASPPAGPQGSEATIRPVFGMLTAGEPTWFLILIENRISLLDQVLGETISPSAMLALDVLEIDDSVTCVPYLAGLHGFDTRIGNQVSIKCQAVPHTDSAAIIITHVLYNPFFAESGFITTLHSARLDDKFELTFLRAHMAPHNVFETGKSPFGGAPTFSPSDPKKKGVPPGPNQAGGRP